MEAVFVALGALGGGLLTAVATAWANRNKTEAETEKTDAEAAEIISRTATDLLDRAMSQSDATEAKLMVEIKKLENKVDLLNAVISSLVEQLQDHGIEPALPAIWHQSNDGFPPMPPLP